MRRSALALLLGCLLLVAGVSAIDGYDYYQTIEYAATDQDVYQQDIVIHRSSGDAYNETAGGLETWHLYVGDHCQEDYGDVRFTDAAGAVLAYYLWPDYDNSSARFTVRLEGADRDGVLAVHYGNPSAATTGSDGDATFLFFDQFNDLSKWTMTAGTWSAVGGEAYQSVAGGTRGIIQARGAPLSPSDSIMIESRGRILSGNAAFGALMASGRTSQNDASYVYGSWRYDSSVKKVGVIGDKWSDVRARAWTVGAEYRVRMAYQGSLVSMYFDDDLVIDQAAHGITATTYPAIRTWDAQVKMDHFLVRAYSANPLAALTFSGEQETAAPPITAFTATPAAGLAPLAVQFTDRSAGGPTSWIWSFGDGGTSTDQNPQHTYTTPGTYTVNLTATNEYGSDYELKTDYITVYGPITAQFSATPTGGTAPLTVQFTDLSTGGPTSWLWDFGDGNTSTDQNPQHTYTAAGAHTVTLTASHPYDSDTETKPAYIIVAVLQPFPGLTNIPRDLAGNGLYTDINGNNRLDYNDLTVFFQHLAWAKTAQPIACFDFNGNGWLDYNDVITLFSTIMEEHT